MSDIDDGDSDAASDAASDADEALPGQDAINAVLEKAYNGQTPVHFRTAISYEMGGPDPLPAIAVYRSEVGEPHWHFVTFGFSELGEKDPSLDPSVSGFGFELTFRLKRGKGETDPPNWVAAFLQNLARYVFNSGNPFDRGHHVPCNGPIALEHDTKIQAVCFTEDNTLAGQQASPNGSFQFLQAVGITLAEQDLIRDWNGEGCLAAFRAKSKCLVTDLARDDFYGDAKLRDSLTAKAATEPSTTEDLYIQPLGWTPFGAKDAGVLVQLQTPAVEGLLRVFRKRLPFDKTLVLAGDACAVLLGPPGTVLSAHLPDDVPVVVLKAADCQNLLATLKPEPGRFEITPTLAFEVQAPEPPAQKRIKIRKIS